MVAMQITRSFFPDRLIDKTKASARTADAVRDFGWG
jgi:hypothetical protein